jgi:hypothetical protein
MKAEQLFEAGWPGERAHRGAARNRVYNAIHTLRHVFELTALARRDRGWFLNAEIRMVVVTGARTEGDSCPSTSDSPMHSSSC